MKNTTGDIIYLNKPLMLGRSKKHGVVVYPAEKWMLYINTRATNVFRGPKIKHKIYPFLEGKDRYISCTNVYNYTYTPGGYNQVIATIDDLKKEDLLNLKSYLMAGNTIPPIQYRTICNNIDNRIKEV